MKYAMNIKIKVSLKDMAFTSHIANTVSINAFRE